MTVDMTPKDDRPTAVDPDVPGGDLISDDYAASGGAGGWRMDGVGQPYPDDQPMAPGFEPMTEDEVAGMVESVTSLIGWVLPTPPDAPGFWLPDEREMGAIVPPATRVVNKRPRAVAVMQRSDELILAAQIGRYALSRVRYLRELEAEPDPDVDTDFGLDDAADTPEPFPGAGV